MDLALTAAVVFFAASVQGLSGFGFGLVALGLLTMFQEVQAAVPTVVLLGYATSVAMGWQLRRHFSLSLTAPLVVGVMVGVPLGATFLKSVPAHVAVGGLGVVLCAYTLYALLVRPPRQREPGRPLGVAAGVVGGVLGGAFGTAGPPLVAFTTITPWSKDTIKATLQALFVVSGTFTLSLYLWMGLLTGDGLLRDLAMVPVMLGGVWAGSQLSDRVDQDAFRRVLLIGLLLVGLVYVYRWIATGAAD